MSERLELLKPTLDSFKRDFSVFDFGSGIEETSVGAEIAHEYPNAVVVCAEKDPLRFTPAGRVMVLRKEFTAADLERLSRCEHFDLVLALNILHWTGAEWFKYTRALARLGTNWIAQVPPLEDTNPPGREYRAEILRAFEAAGVWKLGETSQFPRHPPRPIFHIGGDPTYLSAKDWWDEDECVRGLVFEDDEFCEIELLHAGRREGFIHGLTLTNYAALGGVWPSAEKVVEAIRRVDLSRFQPRHGDLQPWNLRFDGVKVAAIDPAGSDWGCEDSEGIERCVLWAEENLR